MCDMAGSNVRHAVTWRVRCLGESDKLADKLADRLAD